MFKNIRRIEFMRKAFESMNEMEVAAFVAMAAFVALFLMLGDALWKSIAVRRAKGGRAGVKTTIWNTSR
ncbi:MAG TPA: hypothetical protein VMH30_03505 [Verrucomicrobiae bacterium]|nr:hypothetical protein [Verrucomicrobiae bacterium]